MGFNFALKLPFDHLDEGSSLSFVLLNAAIIMKDGIDCVHAVKF